MKNMTPKQLFALAYEVAYGADSKTQSRVKKVIVTGLLPPH
jgi:hypothetical protein